MTSSFQKEASGRKIWHHCELRGFWVSFLLYFSLFVAMGPNPHLPSSQELDEKLSGTRHKSDGRGYQAHSTETFMGKARNAAGWVKDKLSAIRITPARLALGLGILLVLYTWNRNKKLVKWSVLTVTGWLLVAFGGAAIVLRWPHLN